MWLILMYYVLSLIREEWKIEHRFTSYLLICNPLYSKIVNLHDYTQHFFTLKSQ
jgi:hypothetical protein